MKNLENIDSYIKTKLSIAKGKSQVRTAIQYGKDIKKILSFTSVLDCKKEGRINVYSNGELLITTMTKSDFLDIATEILTKYKNVQTRNKYILILKDFVKFLDDKEILACDMNDIFKSKSMKVESTKGEINNGTIAMPYEKFETFRDWLITLDDSNVYTQRKKVSVLLEMTTGLRPSELLVLEVDNIDFENGLVLVADAKGGKSRKTKIMSTPMMEIKSLLNLYKMNEGFNKEEKYLFRVNTNRKFQGTQATGHLKYQNYNNLIHEVMNSAIEAGIIEENDKTTGHGLRKLFSSYLAYEKGMKPSMVASLLGHSNLDTILRYIKPREEKAFTELEDALDF